MTANFFELCKGLKDASINFQRDIQQITRNSFNVVVDKTPEDAIAKKLEDLNIYTSKYRLLQASPTSLMPKIVEHVQDDHARVIADYSDEVKQHLLDNAVVRLLSGNQAVVTLLNAPNNTLPPELLARKEKIIFGLHYLGSLEKELLELEENLIKKINEEWELVNKWDEKLGKLRDATRKEKENVKLDTSGPNYKKIERLVSKSEQMRCLLKRLVTITTSYNWMEDPENVFKALDLTREYNTVEGVFSTVIQDTNE